jgi:hypothetical protein
VAKQPNHTTSRDVSILVNNALLGWRKCYYLVDLEDKKGAVHVEKRMAKLRAYMEAHLQPIIEQCNEGLLSDEEAVYILLAETAMVIGTRLKGVSKFPSYLDLSARILSDSTDVITDEDWEAPGE